MIDTDDLIATLAEQIRAHEPVGDLITAELRQRDAEIGRHERAAAELEATIDGHECIGSDDDELADAERVRDNFIGVAAVLHEQAHGRRWPIRLCDLEPCRQVREFLSDNPDSVDRVATLRTLAVA